MSKATQEEWYEKIRSFTPSWLLTDSPVARAYFMALSKVAADVQTMVENHVKATFILQASGDMLDVHGDERTLSRLTAIEEPDYQYARRVQVMLNTETVPALESAINQVLIVGTCDILEDELEDDTLNAFTVQLSIQRFEPFSFAGREHFADREDFIGSSESDENVIESVKQVIETNKALGTTYRVIDTNGVVL